MSDFHARVQAPDGSASAERRETLAELSRELDVAQTVIRDWKRGYEIVAATAVRAGEGVVPASALREAQARIKELVRALRRKTMENEILRAAAEVAKWQPGCRPTYVYTFSAQRAREEESPRRSSHRRPAAPEVRKPRSADDPKD